MKTTLAFIIVILLTGSFVSKSETADIYLERGKVAIINKKLEDAYRLLSNSIYLDTTNYESFYYRGIVLLYTNKYFDAVEDFTKTISLKDDFADAYNNRGLSYSYTDELELAIEDFSKAIKLDKRFHEALMNRGSAYLAIGQFDEAKKDLAAAEKLNPKNPELHYQKGRLNYISEKFKAAIADYTKAIELGLDNPKLYYNRANAYVKDNQFAKAVADYTTVLKSEPEDMEALNNRAYAYDKLGKTELAEKDKALLNEIRLKLFPPVIVNSYKKLADESGRISIDVPEDWWFDLKDAGDRIEFIISKDSMDTASEALVIGAVGGYFSTIPDEWKSESDEAIIELWNDQQVIQAQSFEAYTYLQKKTMRFKGWKGSQNISRVQFAKGYITFIMVEFVLVNNGKIFYCYFQVPENEYDSYKEIFDKMESSIEVKAE